MQVYTLNVINENRIYTIQSGSLRDPTPNFSFDNKCIEF